MRKSSKKDINNDNLLICVDESDEFSAAMNYACKMAKKDKCGLILLYVIEEENFRHWKGVENIMRKEQVEQAKEVLGKHILYIEKNFLLKVKSLIKKGDKLETILSVLKNKKLNIKNLILGLAMDEPDNNKIISSLTSNLRKKLTLPITIVPGNI